MLVSRTRGGGVSSPLGGLASRFGMVLGVSPSLCPPQRGVFNMWWVVGGVVRVVCVSFTPIPVCGGCVCVLVVLFVLCLRPVCGGVFSVGRLVPVHCRAPYGVSMSGLSTPCSVGGLHHQIGGWKPCLGGDFPLRCFQRLFVPNVASQPCPWRGNWYTRGSSVPVLSYWG